MGTPESGTEDPKGPGKMRNGAVYLVVGADVCEHYGVFATSRIGLEAEDNPTVVLDPTGPQASKLTAESMGSEHWIERVSRQ